MFKGMTSETSPALAEPPSWLVGREQYHAMAEAGIFKSSDKVELIKGRIVAMMPLGPWHVFASETLHKALLSAYGERFHIRSPGVVGMGEHSEPQPDVVVLRRREDGYRTNHPHPEDVVLLIEIADSSRAYDLGTKHDLYAEYRIQEFWVVDGKRRCVHVSRDPQEGTFREMKIYQPGESIPLPEGDGAMLPVSEAGL
jgi:Uma2 family endonuclease